MWSARDVKLRGVVQAREVERRLSVFGSLDPDESVAVRTRRRYHAKHRVAYTRTRRTHDSSCRTTTARGSRTRFRARSATGLRAPTQRDAWPNPSHYSQRVEPRYEVTLVMTVRHDDLQRVTRSSPLPRCDAHAIGYSLEVYARAELRASASPE